MCLVVTAQPLSVPDRTPPRSASLSEEDLEVDGYHMDTDEEEQQQDAGASKRLGGYRSNSTPTWSRS
ncbi:hypothetical protein E2C01_059370 [Portunus trituberculatus]|uniref:Uncharacterized protein n=1 Tax=Portunus trituberculatus TaxID=210409 RepID=A0A5B7H7E0_PORTR|nr:hypothetical protein [Portunus trituberculatus]